MKYGIIDLKRLELLIADLEKFNMFERLDDLTYNINYLKLSEEETEAVFKNVYGSGYLRAENQCIGTVDKPELDWEEVKKEL